MSGQLAGYVRVSSRDQNPARQVESIGDVDRLFTDHLSGGSRADRVALAELIAWSRRGDQVRVSSMDRLARSVIDLHNLVDEFIARGVAVHFIKENLTFKAGGEGDAMGRLLMGIMGSVAEFERAIIRERQAEGIAAAKARGVYRGRKRALTDEQVAKAIEAVERGVPKAKVARDFGVSRQTLYTALPPASDDK